MESNNSSLISLFNLGETSQEVPVDDIVIDLLTPDAFTSEAINDAPSDDELNDGNDTAVSMAIDDLLQKVKNNQENQPARINIISDVVVNPRIAGGTSSSSKLKKLLAMPPGARVGKRTFYQANGVEETPKYLHPDVNVIEGAGGLSPPSPIEGASRDQDRPLSPELQRRPKQPKQRSLDSQTTVIPGFTASQSTGFSSMRKLQKSLNQQLETACKDMERHVGTLEFHKKKVTDTESAISEVEQKIKRLKEQLVFISDSFKFSDK